MALKKSPRCACSCHGMHIQCKGETHIPLILGHGTCSKPQQSWFLGTWDQVDTTTYVATLLSQPSANRKGAYGVGRERTSTRDTVYACLCAHICMRLTFSLPAVSLPASIPTWSGREDSHLRERFGLSPRKGFVCVHRCFVTIRRTILSEIPVAFPPSFRLFSFLFLSPEFCSYLRVMPLIPFFSFFPTKATKNQWHSISPQPQSSPA